MPANPQPQNANQQFGATRNEEIPKRPYKEAYRRARDFSKEDSEVEICLPSGDAVSFAYAYKAGGAYAKDGTVLVCFDGVAAKIEGRNLEELATLLNYHNAKFIQVKHKPEGGKAPDSEPYIDRVTFYKRDLWPDLLSKSIGIEIEEEI